MVFVLVFLTLAAFIAVDWFLERRRAAKADGVATVPIRRIEMAPSTPPGATSYFVHPGHAWVKVAHDGDVHVGASDFASNFAGDVSRVELPAEGTRLRQGEAAWTLVSDASRRLTQVMPIEGTVVAVNRRLARDPMLVQRSSTDDGWILQVRPTRLIENLRNLFGENLAEVWNQATRARLTATMGSELGRLANDGGVWVTGFGEMIDDDSWNALKHELFPDAEAPAGSNASVTRR